ncbi:GDSL-like lipase/acylhydrolase family protein [Breznakibacter xylanolyticus]|uniref:GDSL-like lipase/acylhydrolase family protein n=1 Tax=Breznakibacter xylanolyticus TaxID=990 RepID=A0A2W7NUZ3_9BACT|nr:SGNH/GDSL hydrolase family protein [Breznakibacter xylanolyticus]PZX20414.1 GDSL-like lipase/acylhydrolase family protein [Breznakibacter xylanolyticus]
MLNKSLFVAACMLLGVAQAQKPTIGFDHAQIRYEGRIVNRADAAELSWPGTSVTIRFKGTGVSATLQDLDTANYYNVIVDNKVVGKIHPDNEKRSYTLVAGLKKGEHEVTLFKRTEWDKGKTLFYGFDVTRGGKVLPPAPAKQRRIEFYGNSITCGYANEDFAGEDRWYGYFQNNYETYAAITARHFDAAYHCIGKSGIGITVSWFPMVMGEMYHRADPTDSLSQWDFSQYVPDVVVINLFQNDSWLVNKPEHEQFVARFGSQAPDSSAIIAAYGRFVGDIRARYPKANIICALGSMDATREGSFWPGYIASAVNSLGDDKIYTLFFPFKNSYGHPSVSEQQAMAKQLIGFIEDKGLFGGK